MSSLYYQQVSRCYGSPHKDGEQGADLIDVLKQDSEVTKNFGELAARTDPLECLSANVLVVVYLLITHHVCPLFTSEHLQILTHFVKETEVTNAEK